MQTYPFKDYFSFFKGKKDFLSIFHQFFQFSENLQKLIDIFIVFINSTMNFYMMLLDFLVQMMLKYSLKLVSCGLHKNFFSINELH